MLQKVTAHHCCIQHQREGIFGTHMWLSARYCCMQQRREEIFRIQMWLSNRHCNGNAMVINAVSSDGNSGILSCENS